MTRPNARCKKCSRHCVARPDQICGKCRGRLRDFYSCYLCGGIRYKKKAGNWLVTRNGLLCVRCQRQKQEDCAA